MNRLDRARQMVATGVALGAGLTLDGWVRDRAFLYEVVLVAACALMPPAIFFYVLPKLERERDRPGYRRRGLLDAMAIPVCVVLAPGLRVAATCALAPQLVIGIAGATRRPPVDPTADVF